MRCIAEGRSRFVIIDLKKSLERDNVSEPSRARRCQQAYRIFPVDEQRSGIQCPTKVVVSICSDAYGLACLNSDGTDSFRKERKGTRSVSSRHSSV